MGSKRKVTLLGSLVLALSLMLGSSVFAANKESITLKLSPSGDEGHVVILSGGDYPGMTLPARMIEGKLYLRGSNSVGIAENWKADEGANNETLVIREDIPVEILFGKVSQIRFNETYVDVDDVTMEQLESGFYPVRQVYELAGYTVNYDVATHTITISK